MNSAQRLAARMVGNIRLAPGCKSLLRPLTTATNRKVLTCVQIPQLSLPAGIRLKSTSGNKLKVVNIEKIDDFYKVIEASCTTPAFVYFHSKRCERCNKFGPRLEAILAEKNGKVFMGTVDYDEGYDVAEEYGVEELPTVMAIKNGDPDIASQFVGVISDNEIRAFVDKVLKL